MTFYAENYYLKQIEDIPTMLTAVNLLPTVTASGYIRIDELTDIESLKTTIVAQEGGTADGPYNLAVTTEVTAMKAKIAEGSVTSAVFFNLSGEKYSGAVIHRSGGGSFYYCLVEFHGATYLIWVNGVVVLESVKMNSGHYSIVLTYIN